MDNRKELIASLEMVLAQGSSEEWLINLYNETEKFQITLPLPEGPDYTLHVRSGDFYRTMTLTRAFKNRLGIPAAVHTVLSDLLKELEDGNTGQI